MKKNKFNAIIFIIPLVVATILIGGVFVYKLFFEGSIPTRAAGTPVQKASPQIQGVAGKPSKGYGALAIPSPTASPTPKGKDIDQLTSESEDDGKTELSEIDSLSSGL